MELRVGLSGAGPTGLDAVQDTMRQDDCRIVAVHDARTGVAAEFASRCGIGFSTDDFDTLLGAGVDFVVLAGPPAERLDQVRRAVEQSVPCLLHTPMAPDLATAREMHELAERHDVRLGVHVPGQGDPVVEQLRRMIAADWLGGVVCVQAIRASDELLRTGEIPYGLDPFFGMLCEHVHLTTWLTGRRAVRVTAQTTRSFAPDLDDNGVATAVLRDNIPCTFMASRLARADTYAVHGTDGGLRIAGDRIWLSGQRPFQGHVFDYDTPGIAQVLARRDLEDALTEHRASSELHGRFARWLDDMDDFPCPSEQAVADLETIDAMVRAAHEGRAI